MAGGIARMCVVAAAIALGLGPLTAGPGSADGGAGTFSWGYNSVGQLGDGTGTSSSVPVAVDTSGVLAGKTVTAVGSTKSHACVVAEGAVYCWGWNAFGQLGDGTVTSSSVPVAVDTSGVLADKAVTAVSTGSGHSCALADGAAYCWGYNSSGQLGDGMTTDSAVPVAVDTSGVLAGKTVTAVSIGGSHSCALADGAAYCWGYNDYGQLGDGTVTSSSVPVAVDMSGVLAGKTLTAVSAR